MFRKLLLLSATLLALTLPAFAANAPTYHDSAGTTRGSTGVVIVNPDGSFPTIGAGVGGGLSESDFDTKTGALTETAPATDTASSGLNGRLQRLAQRTTSLITALTNTIVLQPGENHIGEVGNSQIDISVTPALATSGHAAGTSVGGLLTFANAARVSGAAGAPGTSGLLHKVTIASVVANSVQMDMFILNASPSASTCTDNTAFALNSADIGKVIGVAHITDWTSDADTAPSIGQAPNLSLPFALVSSTTLYGCLVTRATYTPTGASDAVITDSLIRN